MKVDFQIDTANYVEYCAKCHSANTVTRTRINGDSFYTCSECKSVEPRAIIIDPKLYYKIDDDKEYCHKSVGVFIFNKRNEVLMFKLNKFPFGWTIPAGHVDLSESPDDAIIREAKEESGLVIGNVKHLSTLKIDKDGCRRGADRHYWDVYCARTDDDSAVIDENEGSEYKWCSVEQMFANQNTFAVDYILRNLKNEITTYIK